MPELTAGHSPVNGIYFTLMVNECIFIFFFSSRRRHTRSLRDWSSDVCSFDLDRQQLAAQPTNGFQRWPSNRSREPGLCRIQFGVPMAFGCFGSRREMGRGALGANVSGKGVRSEERRVGKEGRGRWAEDDEKEQ